MNDQNLKKLTEELKAEGALEKEAENFAFFSKNLSNLYNFERSQVLKNKFLDQNIYFKNKFFMSKQMFATAFLSLVLLLGFTSVVTAQNSLPGQPLYPVKRLSEKAVLFVNPSFNSEILKRRSEEIKELSDKKDGDSFHNIINEYEKELDENKQINSKKIEESRKNLEEAKKNSLDEHREDIERVIIKTENRQGEVKREDDKPASSEDNNRKTNQNSEDHPRF